MNRMRPQEIVRIGLDIGGYVDAQPRLFWQLGM